MENKERTLYCGNLSDKVTEDLLYELFLQAGPLENVRIPKDKDGGKRNFGFITFKHAVSVCYAVALMNGISLYGRALRLDARSGSTSTHNPYLEQLRQYQNSVAQQGYQQNDNRSKRHSSRRYDSRTNNDKWFDSVQVQQPVNLPVLYPGFNLQYAPPMSFQQNSSLLGDPFNPVLGMFPNQWSGFR